MDGENKNSANSTEQITEERKVVSYRGYDNRYEIIAKENFPKYIRKKIKKAWYNMSNKLCKKSFIYLGDADVEKGEIVYVDVIEGIASKKVEDRKTITLEELYKDAVIFVGYMEDTELAEEFKNVFNKINY